jgi:hypothetical protein
LPGEVNDAGPRTPFGRQANLAIDVTPGARNAGQARRRSHLHLPDMIATVALFPLNA